MSRSVLRIVASISGAALLAVIAGCSSKEAAEPAAAAPSSTISKDASVVDLMRDPIAPTADALWAGVEPGSTDAQWTAFRLKAQTLVDVSKAIIEEGRVVAHPGQKLKDPPGQDDLSPEQAQAEISKDRAAYVALATVMQGIGGDYLAAIDSRKVEALEEAGGRLSEVCGACHARYWYPKSAAAPAP
jgi:cytochrome c556